MLIKILSSSDLINWKLLIITIPIWPALSTSLLISRTWACVIFWGHIRSQPHVRFRVRFSEVVFVVLHHTFLFSYIFQFLFFPHIFVRFRFFSAYFYRVSCPQVLSTGLVGQYLIFFNLSHLQISLHKQPVFKKYFHMLEHNNVDSSFWFLPFQFGHNFSFCFFLTLFIHFTFKERENYLWIFPKCQTLSTIVTADGIHMILPGPNIDLGNSSNVNCTCNCKDNCEKLSQKGRHLWST